MALGTVIDTDHWRHLYLLIGLIWGAIALEYRYQRGFPLAAGLISGVARYSYADRH